MAALLAVALVLVFGLAACGGGDSSTESTSTIPPESASTATTTTTPPSATGTTKAKGAKASHPSASHASGGGGAADFETKGGDNSIQESGSEAPSSELDAAATALHGYLDARAASDWAKACSYLSAGVAKSLGQLTGKKGSTCPKSLAALSSGLPPSALSEAAVAEVGALRVKGTSAFLLFHGSHDTSYFMPMAREDGSWKVAAIAPSALL
jgi:hypothetical protein